MVIRDQGADGDRYGRGPGAGSWLLWSTCQSHGKPDGGGPAGRGCCRQWQRSSA